MKKEEKEKEEEKPLKGLYEHSQEVQEIMGRTPGWVCRWGMVIMFLLAVTTCVICASIKFPGAEEIGLQPCHPYAPEAVRASVTGRIAVVRHGNGERMCAGDSIAYIGNGVSGCWVVSPIAGRMEAHRHVAEGIALSEGDTVCWVLPDGTDRAIFCGRVPLDDICPMSEGLNLDIIVEPAFRNGTTVHAVGRVSCLSTFPDTDGRLYFEVTPSEAIPCMPPYRSVRCRIPGKDISLMEKMLSTFGWAR